MRRLFIILAAMALGQAVMTAQTVQASQEAFNGITISNAEIDRNADNMMVNMDMDMSKFNVPSNKAVLLTPYVVKDGDRVGMPSLGIYGHDRYFYYVRNDKTMVEGSAETSYRENEVPDLIPYFASVPYEDWMAGSELVLEKKTYGCCGNLVKTEYCTLGGFDMYKPVFLYISPAVEMRKERVLEGNAFVDYPVSQTVIYPEYHNNVEELAKIRSTIDSVRLDTDVKVTSIFIKGYASPESPYDNNTRLAKGRTESIRKYVLDLYDFPESVIKTDYEPENWEGLREYLVGTDLPYKKQILALIDKDEEPDRKEWLIKSQYKQDYKYLLENCYPYLRRTYYRIDYVVRSFTYEDVDHIRELVSTRPQNLSLQEFYLAAQGLDPESEQFGEIFDVAVRMYPEDPVANLNAANAAMQRGDMKSAGKFLDRAGSMPESVYARGVYCALEGDIEEAKKYFELASKMGVAEAAQQLQELN